MCPLVFHGTIVSPPPFFAATVPDPDCECISENVLDTWQKGNKTFKKFEYTIRIEFEGRVRIRTKIAFLSEAQQLMVSSSLKGLLQFGQHQEGRQDEGGGGVLERHPRLHLPLIELALSPRGRPSATG